VRETDTENLEGMLHKHMEDIIDVVANTRTITMSENLSVPSFRLSSCKEDQKQATLMLTYIANLSKG
jgi:hypothetical protein